MSAVDAANVIVSVRIRPPPKSTSRVCIEASPEGILLEGKEGDVSTLDGYNSIVGSDCDQIATYDAIAEPLMARLADGYSCTLIAYGQTGSGKTHTIFGPPGVLTEAALTNDGDGTQGAASAPTDWGILPRVALELLASSAGTLHASAIEVYQEKAFDLLADRVQLAVGTQKAGRKSAAASKDKGNEAVHKSTCKCRECYLAKEAESKARKERLERRPKAERAMATSFSELSGGPAAGAGGRGGAGPPAGAPAAQADVSFATIGETRVPLSSPADVARLARTIELTRTALGHNLNSRSSRSHCLVHLHLTERAGDAGNPASAVAITKRQVLIVDLAGSERILKTGAEGAAALQAVAINTSLSALGKCVRALAANSNYVPYRESTLTQLLRSSLAGKASTSVVVNVSAEAAHSEESRCSLEYGQRMGAVRTKAAVVTATSADGEESYLRRQLDKARPVLAEMEANGFGERFGKASLPGEINQFQSNTVRIAELEATVTRDKIAFAELNAHTHSNGTPSSAAAARALGHRIQEAVVEMQGLQELVARSKAVAGFYIPPRAIYTRKLAEVRAFEGRLEQIAAARAHEPTPSSGPQSSYLSADHEPLDLEGAPAPNRPLPRSRSAQFGRRSLGNGDDEPIDLEAPGAPYAAPAPAGASVGAPWGALADLADAPAAQFGRRSAQSATSKGHAAQGNGGFGAAARRPHRPSHTLSTC